jgi:hypothetical protein
MVFGIAFLMLPFADCLLQEAQAATYPDVAEESDISPPLPTQEQPEVLTRGPVHEAFAEPISLQTEEGLVVSKQPPLSIEEIQPMEKPEGGHFIWVPGYWSWDGYRNNYIWVSGCWRIAPPKMSWVSGYWTRVNSGWKWVSGFWMQSGYNEIEYLKAPPDAFDIEASGPAPTEGSIWISGCWYWSNDRYVSRPGYWLQGQAGWVWTPSHYVWTPRGYIFSNGHWDYTLERRGVLFAPVYFPSSVVYTRPGYRYSLGIVVDLGLLKVNLFCAPRYSHYYFGDYYDESFIRVGIFPCFESERRRSWYDPIYQYDRWHSRDPRWEEHERHSYELRRNYRDLRPAKSYREQEDRLSKLPESQRDGYQIARPVNATQSAKSAAQKFVKSDNNTRQKTSKQANDVQNYREERRQWESSTDTGSKTSQPNVERMKDSTTKGEQPSSKGTQPSVERIDSKSVQTSDGRGASTAQSERVKDATQKDGQPSMERAKDDGTRNDRSPSDQSGSAGQSGRVKDYSRDTSSSDDRYSSAGRSDRIRVPDSPVSDRGSAYTNGDRYPSTPAEEHRSQDNARDSRSDNGQRGGRYSR